MGSVPDNRQSTQPSGVSIFKPSVWLIAKISMLSFFCKVFNVVVERNVEMVCFLEGLNSIAVSTNLSLGQ